MKLLQHVAQFRRDALRQKHRNARADADEFHVRNRAQPAEQILELFIAEQQRIAATKQHIADGGGPGDVVDLPVELRMEIVAGGVADQTRPGAIPAVRRAAVGDQKQHAVGIAMHQTRHGRMGVLAARIAHFPGGGMGFLQPRNDLAADGAILVRRIDQVEEVRRDGQRELGIGQLRAGVFLRRQGGHQFLKLRQGGDTMFKLPLPTIPIRRRRLAPKAASGRMELFEFVKLFTIRGRSIFTD